MRRILGSVRLCASSGVESVKPAHHSLLLQGELKFSENRASCVEFFKDCVQYGKTVVMACEAFVPYSPFSQIRSSQDLLGHAIRIGTERIEVPVEAAVPIRGAFFRSGRGVCLRCAMSGMRKFNLVHKKCLASLRKMDHRLNALHNWISAWVTELDAYSTFPVFDIKCLRDLCRVWMKNREVVGHVLTALLLLDERGRYLPSLETHASFLRPIVFRP
jgi:hypothetical protein